MEHCGKEEGISVILNTNIQEVANVVHIYMVIFMGKTKRLIFTRKKKEINEMEERMFGKATEQVKV